MIRLRRTQNYIAGLHLPSRRIFDVSLAALGLLVVVGLGFSALFFPQNPAFAAGSPDDFVTTWKTDNEGVTNSTSIRIVAGGAGGALAYNYEIDWDNDGVFDETVTQEGPVDHDFGVPGEYTVRIRGDFHRFFNAYNNEDTQKLISVDQWGAIQWRSMNWSFAGMPNLEVRATDAPDLSLAIDTSGMFQGSPKVNMDVSNWDMSTITNTSGMFFGATTFNQPLSSWDVSQVTDMSYMFSASGLSIENYDETLVGWAAQVLQSNVTLTGPGAGYCAGVTARQSIIDTYNWSITDGGRSCGTITLNGGGYVDLDAEDLVSGSVVGTLAAQGFTPTSYTIGCDQPLPGDSNFSITGVNQLVINNLPATMTDYNICVRAHDAYGPAASRDLSVIINVAPASGERVISGVEFGEYNGKKLLTISGAGFLVNQGGAEYAFIRSMVSLNGVALPFCSEGMGLGAAEMIALFQEDFDMDITGRVSDDPPCYRLVDFATQHNYLTPTEASIVLPDDFDTAAEGTVSVNGSPVYTYNRPTGGGHPTAYVNGDKQINQHPTIPKRPIFSGVAAPGAQVTVTVHSDPVSCSAVADSNGNWSCTLPTDLEPGEHTVYVVVTNPDSSVVNLGPYTVRVVGDDAATVNNATPLAPNAGVGILEQLTKYQQKRQSRASLVVVGAVLSVAGLLLATGLFAHTRRRMPKKYTRR